MKILDVGQCGFDGPRMAELWHDRLGATVDRVDDGASAADKLKHGKYDIVLVNRLLAADGSSGLEVIQELKRMDDDVPIMLVSDLPEAQEEAVALGAERGFGKAALSDPGTLDLVKRVASHHARRS